MCALRRSQARTMSALNPCREVFILNKPKHRLAHTPVETMCTTVNICSAGPALERGRSIILCALRRRIPRLKEITRFELDNEREDPREHCVHGTSSAVLTARAHLSPQQALNV